MRSKAAARRRRARQKTVAYIVEQMKAAGLQPGGDLKDGKRAWTQDVPLAQFDISGPVESSVTAAGQRRAADARQGDRRPRGGDGHRSSAIKDAPLVFLGYGVTAPERKWDDYKGVDMHGKIGIVLINDPDFETGSGDFGGKA